MDQSDIFLLRVLKCGIANDIRNSNATTDHWFINLMSTIIHNAMRIFIVVGLRSKVWITLTVIVAANLVHLCMIVWV